MNEEVRRSAGASDKMSDKDDRKALKWLGHMERMSGQWLTKTMYENEVEGRRERGRPCASWLNGVKTRAMQGQRS